MGNTYDKWEKAPTQERTRQPMRTLTRSQFIFAIASICALIMLALVPVTASSQDDGPYGLRIAEKPVTEENKDNILGDDTKSMSYDPDTRTLRLNNAPSTPPKNAMPFGLQVH